MYPEAVRVFAIVVCYKPPPGLSERLQKIAAQVDHLIVWDNGSDVAPAGSGENSSSISWILHPENIGIAAAQNRALAAAQERGATHAILFDHDSSPAPDMVARLRQQMPLNADNRVAICAPRIRYALEEIACRWPQPLCYGFRLRYARDMKQAEPVYLAIASGMLIDLMIWQRLGGFDERLFIDLVDTEYCLHARKHGYTVMACPDAELQHALGEVQGRQLAGIRMYPTHHSSWRHYMINRNRWILTRRYALKYPGWLAYEWLGACKLAIKALLFEPERWNKLGAMIKGNLAGLSLILRQPKAQRHGL